MDVNAPFLTYRHPVAGEMSLTVTGNAVRLCCRWPFDRSTDEWIAIDNEFEREEYRRSLLELPKAGTVRIKGRNAGYVEFTVLAEDEVKIDLRDNAAERPTRLVCTLRLSARDFLPEGQQ